jgi:hypothetical protein
MGSLVKCYRTSRLSERSLKNAAGQAAAAKGELNYVNYWPPLALTVAKSLTEWWGRTLVLSNVHPCVVMPCVNVQDNLGHLWSTTYRVIPPIKHIRNFLNRWSMKFHYYRQKLPYRWPQIAL